jgi:hypothetical protein
MRSRHIPAGLPEWVVAGLQSDPAFRVTTMDGTGWLDPFTGAVVPAPFGPDAVARDHLMRNRTWQTTKPLPLPELLRIRWLLYLRANLEMVPALRILRQGRWLNPYTGTWHAGPSGEMGTSASRLAEHLAWILADCKEAQGGRMLEKWQLEQLAGQGPDASGPIPVIPDSTPVRVAALLDVPVPERVRPRPKTDFISIKAAFLRQLRRPARIPGYQLVLHFEPHAPLPRDFYDFIELADGRHATVLGSVSGGGPGAALVAGSVLEVLRKAGSLQSDAIGLLAMLNDGLRLDQLPGCSVGITVAVLDTAHHRLECASAGHPPVLLASPRRDAPLRQLRSQGGGLGTLVGKDFRRNLGVTSVELEPGDVVVMAGRGLGHAANPADPEGGRWAINGAVVANLRKPLAELAAAVIACAKAGAERPRDDLAFLAIRMKDESWLLEGRHEHP